MKAEGFELEACGTCHRGFMAVGNGDQRAVSGVQHEYVLTALEERYRAIPGGRSFGFDRPHIS